MDNISVVDAGRIIASIQYIVSGMKDAIAATQEIRKYHTTTPDVDQIIDMLDTECELLADTLLRIFENDMPYEKTSWETRSASGALRDILGVYHRPFLDLITLMMQDIHEIAALAQLTCDEVCQIYSVL